MWLLNTTTLELRDFIGSDVPRYAILSHTWGPEEVSFRDMRKDHEAAKLKAGYSKVQKCCENALQDGYQYVWIDTCCIDKRSSAELSEAINSMYKWYQNAGICYAYLADVSTDGFDPSPEVKDDQFSKSLWFTRGWTLQELIAPWEIHFYDQDWIQLGKKISDPYDRLPESGVKFIAKLSSVTGIDKFTLENPFAVTRIAVAEKMAWAARRQTTKAEDIAYALMGLFGVNMPVLYGEGETQAFQRLQLQIIQRIPDYSIFVWRSKRESSGLLAESPRDFIESGLKFSTDGLIPTLQPFSMTNLGLSIKLPISRLIGDLYLAALGCWVEVNGETRRIRLHLKKLNGNNLYRRVDCTVLNIATNNDNDAEDDDIYVLENEQLWHIYSLH